ncbi:MAG: hypothetical protein IJ461_06315, partial [Clostridia bacterium]|nr:hypothetical protein [Clostridia bacterium]
MDKRKPPRFKKNPRQVALNILVEMEKMQSYAGLSLDKHLNQSGLMGPDRRLAAALVLDVTENKLKLDYAIDHFLSKEQKDDTVRSILRLGACQILLYDRIPDSAAVNESVNLVKMAGIVPLSGFVNGVLRTMSREKANISWPKPEEGAKYLSIEYSMPLWLVEQLIADYGFEEARAILSYRLEKHPITLRPNLTRLDDAAFEKLLGKRSGSGKRARQITLTRFLGRSTSPATAISPRGCTPSKGKAVCAAFSCWGRSPVCRCWIAALLP